MLFPEPDTGANFDDWKPGQGKPQGQDRSVPCGGVEWFYDKSITYTNRQ